MVVLESIIKFKEMSKNQQESPASNCMSALSQWKFSKRNLTAQTNLIGWFIPSLVLISILTLVSYLMSTISLVYTNCKWIIFQELLNWMLEFICLLRDDGFKYPYESLIILFNINNLFAHFLIVSSIAIKHM